MPAFDTKDCNGYQETAPKKKDPNSSKFPRLARSSRSCTYSFYSFVICMACVHERDARASRGK